MLGHQRLRQRAGEGLGEAPTWCRYPLATRTWASLVAIATLLTWWLLKVVIVMLKVCTMDLRRDFGHAKMNITGTVGSARSAESTRDLRQDPP